MTVTDTVTALASLAGLEPNRPPSAWQDVCDVSALEPLWGEAALIGTQQIAIFLLPDGRIFVVSNCDPATGAAVISRGIVGSRGDRPTIASPLHKDVYDLQTGQCYSRPGARLPIWHSRIVDDRLEVARPSALIAASHGTSDPAGQRAVASLVQAVRDARPDVTVIDSFVDVQSPDVATVVDELEMGAAAIVVPLLLSAGYHVHVDLAEIVEEASSRRPMRVSGALGPDPRLAVVLGRRLNELQLGDDDQIVLAAAGSSNASAVAECHEMGRMLAGVLGRPVAVSFISAAEPRVAVAVENVRAGHPDARVVIASYLLAPGYFATLAAHSGADATSDPLLRDGEAPPAELVEIVCDLYEAASVFV
jgi:NAD(P)H-dependent nitrite reductase small subunit